MGAGLSTIELPGRALKYESISVCVLILIEGREEPGVLEESEGPSTSRPEVIRSSVALSATISAFGAGLRDFSTGALGSVRCSDAGTSRLGSLALECFGGGSSTADMTSIPGLVPGDPAVGAGVLAESGAFEEAGEDCGSAIADTGASTGGVRLLCLSDMPGGWSLESSGVDSSVSGGRGGCRRSSTSSEWVRILLDAASGDLYRTLPDPVPPLMSPLLDSAVIVGTSPSLPPLPVSIELATSSFPVLLSTFRGLGEFCLDLLAFGVDLGPGEDGDAARELFRGNARCLDVDVATDLDCWGLFR
jgi:hypothetical protein